MEKKKLVDLSENNVKNFRNRMNANHRVNIQRLEAITQEIAQDHKLRELLKSRNTDKLIATYQDTFENLMRNHRITHFNFHDSDRVNLLRVQQPEKHGDRIDRLVMLEAERTKAVVSGDELCPNGKFILWSACAIFDSNSLIGYLELGKEIISTLPVFHSDPGIDLALVIDKSTLNRAQWETSMEMLGREADWERFAEGVIYECTMPRLPTECDRLVSKAEQDHGEVSAEITINNRSWRVVVQPISFALRTVQGNLIVLYDISAPKAAFAQFIRLTASLVLVLMALLIVFFLHGAAAD